MEKLRSKLLIPNILIVALAFGAIFYISYTHYQSYELKASNTTQHTVKELRGLLVTLQERNREMATFLSNDLKFVDHVALENIDKLLDRIVPIHALRQFNIVKVYNKSFRLLACAAQPGLFGSLDDFSPLLIEAEEGDDGIHRAMIYKDKVALVYIKRIVGDYGAIGYVVIGKYLTDRMFTDFFSEELHHHTNISILYDSRTLFSKRGANWFGDVGNKLTSISFPKEIDHSGLLSASLSENVSKKEKQFWHRLFFICLAFISLSLSSIIYLYRVTISVTGSLEKAFLSAEKRASNLEGRFQTLTESINDLVWEIDKNGRYTYTSPRIFDILGYSPEEIIGSTPFNLMPEDEAERVGEIFLEIVRGQKPFSNLRNINIHKDGSLVVLQSSGAPYFDGAGNFLGYRGVDRDITEQDKAREALERSRELLNNVQEIGHIGSWKWDIKTGGLAWSDEAFRIFGLRPQEFEPSYDYFLEAILPEDREQVQHAIRASLDDKTPYNLEHRIVLPDGTQRTVEERGKVVCDEDGSPLTMIGSVQDITEMKKIENDLYKYQNHLEDLVAERTLDLLQAMEESDRANKAKSVFLTSMSHELRTPMNSIIGFSQLLDTDEKEPLSDYQKNYLANILQSGRHLLQLINDVLDLAKIESGGLDDIYVEPVNMCSICHEAVELVRPMAESQNIEISQCTLDKSIFLRADRTRFRQIILNLLSNAIKYNKPGGKVSFSCEESDKKITLSVIDTGPGIAKDKIDYIFEPFDRLGAEASSIEGTGIGLTISKRLVELMHGSIDVESEVGKGTKVSISFPLYEPTAEEKSTVPAQTETQEYDLQGNYTLLYVEDDPLNRELLMETVEHFTPNIKLLTAEDAEKGINIAIKHKPDIILMDLSLPGMNGTEAFLKLKELPETKNIPVVALSGNAMPADIDKALKTGFTDYITKPFNISELSLNIGGILDRSRSPSKI